MRKETRWVVRPTWADPQPKPKGGPKPIHAIELSVDESGGMLIAPLDKNGRRVKLK